MSAEEDTAAGGGQTLRDVPVSWPVAGQLRRVSGEFVTLRTDQVAMPDGDVAARDVLEHPGAVAIVALDDAGQVLLIRQYRHPVGRLLWEVPAGLRDVAGEPPLETAQRELAEEAAYRAGRWHVLVDYFSSPGVTTERLRVFLARDLAPIPPAERSYQAKHEEAQLSVAWLPLDQAVSLILAGDLHNGVAAVGVLAAFAARQRGFAALREAGSREA